MDDEHECRRKKIHSRYCKDFLKSLDIAEWQLWSRKIPRSCLQNQSESVWRKVYEARNDQGLITLTGFDCASFGSLCEIFAPVFDSYTPFIPSGTSCFKREKLKNKERKQKICPEDCLGLVLAWTRTRGSLMALQRIFGMTFSNIDDYLKFAKRIILKVLRNDRRAHVRIPSSEKIEEYKDGERKVTLTVMILLYNLRARMVGINQLQSFYVGALYPDANVEFVP